MNNLRGKGIVVVAILLCTLYLGYRFYGEQQAAAALQVNTLERAIPAVALTQARPGEATDTITLPGNIQAWYEAQIFAQVSGYVKMWHKDYGAQVKEGEVLAEINAPALDAQYSQAKADLDTERAKYVLAELTAKRYVALRPNQAVSEQSISVQVQEAKAQQARVKAAEQNVRNFEALIRFKTIVAPFEGVVTARNINVGNYVNKEASPEGSAGAIRDLFTVADVTKMRLFVSVPETFGPFLKPGLTADVTVPQFPNRHFTAQFLTVAKGFDVSTRTAVTIFTIENDDRALWPGSYATVRITAPVEKKMLTIPSSAMVFQEHGTQVAVVTEDDQVHFKPIAVARILDNTVEVTDGISTSDRIVNNPSAALLEGTKVRIVTPAPGYDLVTGEKRAPEAAAPKQDSSSKPL